jgi:hypothetical protein
MEASLIKTKILSPDLEQKITSSSENQVFKTLIACTPDDLKKAKVVINSNNLMEPTDGLTLAQKKTVDESIVSLDAAAKKFNYKIIKHPERCGGARYTFGTKELSINAKRFDPNDERNVNNNEHYVIGTNRGQSLSVFPNGDILMSYLVRRPEDGGLDNKEQLIKGPGLSIDFSKDLNKIGVIKPNGEIIPLPSVAPLPNEPK